MSKPRRRNRAAMIAALTAEIAADLPILAAAAQLRDACAWQQRATCEAEDDRACEAIDAAIEAIIAAIDARRAGVAPAAADIPEGWVPDAPTQTAEEVAEFLADEWPGDEEVAA